MLPSVKQVTSLGTYRDGGSVSASFLGENGIEYTLLFPVKMDRALGKVGYKPPVLELYNPAEYSSKVTGERIPYTVKSTEPISWQDSAALLQQMASFISGFHSEYLWVFPEMQRAAANLGTNVGT